MSAYRLLLVAPVLRQRRVTFSSTARFAGASFSGDTTFAGTTFSAANFVDATFSSAAVFDGATFSGGRQVQHGDLQPYKVGHRSV
jgi:uncharacterized protein YjbI with pentapeptide repeats